jgi:hypothetical protein
MPWRLAAAAAALAVAASLLGGVTASASAQNAEDALAVQPFSADSGDRCPMGVTKGDLIWNLDSPRIMAIKGVVVDRPVPGDTDPACRDGRLSTTATFVGTSKVGLAVARFVARADNAEEGISTLLSSTPQIDVVSVQVCRQLTAPVPLPGPVPADSCGPVERFQGPLTAAAQRPQLAT